MSTLSTPERPTRLPFNRESALSTPERSTSLLANPKSVPSTPKVTSTSPQKRKLNELSPSILGVTIQMSPKKPRITQLVSGGERCNNEKDIPVVSMMRELTPPRRYQPADPATLELFHAASRHIAGYLKRIGERWFLTFLEVIRGEWTMVIVVADASRIRLPKPVNTLCMIFAEGYLEFQSSINSQKPLYEKKPGCGASLGGAKIAESATLGGYVRGIHTGTIWAVTVAHLFYLQRKEGAPTLMDKECLEMVCCPSVPVLSELKRQNLTDIAKGVPPSLRSGLEKENAEIEDLRYNELKLHFGECAGARWCGVVEGDRTKLCDVAVVEVEKGRIGNNDFGGAGNNFFKRLRTGVMGSRRAEIGEEVVVLGMVSGSSKGIITDRGDAYVYELGGKDGDQYWVGLIDHDAGSKIAKGDSGAWIFDNEGNWVGMNVGGSVSSSTDNNRTFTRSVFIDAEDVIKWVAEIVGEEVDVVLAT